MTAFPQALTAAIALKGPTVVGIDPRPEQLPGSLREGLQGLTGRAYREAAAGAVSTWGQGVIEAVRGEACAVKIQAAFFEQFGAPGWEALEAVCSAARQAGVLVIVDAKRGDIGSTAEAYAHALLDVDGPLQADAVTLSPYLGRESLSPFLARCQSQGKGLFVLLRTSNPGSDELQVETGAAERIGGWIEEWNTSLVGEGYGPVGAVVGATLQAEELSHWRSRLPHTPFLVPGYGAQGASASDCRPCFDGRGMGALVCSSRGVTYPTSEAGEEEAYDADFVAFIRQNALRFREEIARSLA
jgi:orotidine-5'-phosphate decarboxylase